MRKKIRNRDKNAPANLSRRRFLRSGALGAAALGIGPQLFLRGARANQGNKRILLCLFQRGAVDGLNMVVPFGDASYAGRRPDIAIAGPGRPGGAIDLDGFFGLHPSMEALMPAFDAGELALVHACGSHDPTRSHFDAQDFMQTGTPGVKNTTTGWLARHLESTSGDSKLRGVSVTGNMPRVLAGGTDVYAASSLTSLDLGRGEAGTVVRDAIGTMYLGRQDLLGKTVGETLDNYEIFTALGEQGYQPRNGAVYPNSGLGRDLREIAQVIRADVGLEVAFIETGGWDTHARQGGAEGDLADNLGDLANGIAAFRQDLGAEMADICVLAMSEFGRTAAQNGTGGTDHGHGTAMMALGGTVEGGRVYGDWPGLGNSDLYKGRDLAITTDFRDLFGEVVRYHLGNPALGAVFPGHSFNRPGVIRS